MLRVTVKSLLARKLRLLLTALAVVLGVAFVSGTLVLGDTLNNTFDKLFATAYSGTDVGVRGKSAFDVDVSQGGDPAQSRAPVPASVLELVRGVEGVRQAEGDSAGFAQIVRPDGEVVETSGAPTLGGAWLGDTPLNPYVLQEGSAPSPGEVAVDETTATDNDLAVGDRVQVLTQSGPLDVTISGIVSFGESGSLAGATITLFDPATAQQALVTPGTYSEVLAIGDGSVSDEELRDRVAEVLPPRYQAFTGEGLAAEDSNDIKDALGFFSTFLLVFAVISIFVGSFIIFNTFSMLVAQRSRELALLRALGASRRQVNLAVILEAAVVGVIGSTLGLGLGVLLSLGLREVVGLFLGDLPADDLVFRGNTVLWAYLTGVVVTLVAAVAPARRATLIPPVAALRDDVALPAASLRRRAVLGTVVLGAGVVAMAAGLAGGAGILWVGIGALGIFLGAAMLSPFLSRPVVGGVGSALPRLWGSIGRLARENALRNPRRTAATASALMIGLALVAAGGVLAASLVKSANAIIDRSVGADFIVSASNFLPIPGTVAEDVRGVEGIAAVTAFRPGQFQVAGGVAALQGVTADTVDRTLQLEVVDGELAALGERGTMLVAEEVAAENGWEVGDTVPVVFGKTGESELVLGGTYAENQIAGSYLVSLETYEQNFTQRLDQVVAMTVDPGADVDAVREELTATAGASNLEIRDQSEFKQEQRDQINQLLGFIFVLLTLAVLIAALGIVNTLALSVIERTREIGLLRAVGMGRRQVRRMIRLESVVIAIFGTLLGLALGVALGAALVRALNDEGIDQLVIPYGQLAVYLVVGALIGVVAAVWPARRAARLDVLRAITTE
ncbi:MAG TPA: FtsX-like permease family protein [Actinomycetes bacterium]|nr:FtsX-like permease family protein [Actinomycetes bacterium]